MYKPAVLCMALAKPDHEKANNHFSNSTIQFADGK
jgi:hypothetical protein